MVSLYQSDWMWVYEENERYKLFNEKSIKGDYYFLFQRAGIYDADYDSNILESPLSIYEYAVLQEFEKSSTITDVFGWFQNIFVFESKENRNLLLQTFKNLVKKLIFKMYILHMV